ncbi:hypothetical protein ANN_04764 [Periplaneta americana]|uniref:Uncharacterized protein n=1 Tax=Periplaneta americana TaxID=6978 RepID=A0ABQ8T9A9_PERAM|nr:hypothetical protein ANN_04764 [Periplaneta americana]
MAGLCEGGNEPMDSLKAPDLCEAGLAPRKSHASVQKTKALETDSVQRADIVCNVKEFRKAGTGSQTPNFRVKTANRAVSLYQKLALMAVLTRKLGV